MLVEQIDHTSFEKKFENSLPKREILLLRLLSENSDIAKHVPASKLAY